MKELRNVDYYTNEASYRSQQGFEFVHANVIDVFDLNRTVLTTEDGKTLIINWCMSGRSMKSFSVEEIEL